MRIFGRLLGNYLRPNNITLACPCQYTNIQSIKIFLGKHLYLQKNIYVHM